ncbi:MAG: helix-turn-helix transcriptional regulator [Nitrososphaerota archaeon]|nr:helix-turn-helix transcriptional regulator [Nitrososphaerota archaeon]
MPEKGSKRSYSRNVACMILDGGTEYCIDPAENLLGVLGSKWTLAIIGVLGNRPASRFSELVDVLNGVGSKVLADRLRDLQQLGMVSRQVIPTTPVRTEYRLTEQGLSLRKSLIPLLAWAAASQAR